MFTANKNKARFILVWVFLNNAHHKSLAHGRKTCWSPRKMKQNNKCGGKRYAVPCPGGGPDRDSHPILLVHTVTTGRMQITSIGCITSRLCLLPYRWRRVARVVDAVLWVLNSTRLLTCKEATQMQHRYAPRLKNVTAS